MLDHPSTPIPDGECCRFLAGTRQTKQFTSWGGVLEDLKCSPCNALYNTRCSYESDSGQSRKSTTRRRITVVAKEESAITIIRVTKSYPMAEVTKLVDTIRSNDNLDKGRKSGMALQGPNFRMEAPYRFLLGLRENFIR